MNHSIDSTDPPQDAVPTGVVSRALARWQAIPLYWRILAAMLLGAITGVLLKEKAQSLSVPADLVIRLLARWRRR